jgi:hypothetical protein
MPKEEFKKQVEKEPTGRETAASELGPFVLVGLDTSRRRIY